MRHFIREGLVMTWNFFRPKNSQAAIRLIRVHYNGITVYEFVRYRHVADSFYKVYYLICMPYFNLSNSLYLE